MASYLDQLEMAAPERRWPMVRGWMQSEPVALYRELREFRPVLELPELTFVSRFDDCLAVLRQPNVFSVALYKPKQGEYWMAQDETARHWREKSIMRSVLDLEELADIRKFVGQKTSDMLLSADGKLDVVNGLSRAVPIALVQERFGFTGSDPQELRAWSYWNQYDAFHNQPFDKDVVADPVAIETNRKAANQRMVAYLLPLVQRRLAEMTAGVAAKDPVTRLLRLALSSGVQFDMSRVVQNVGGLLIGTVETTSHAVINAMAELFHRPAVLAAAITAAASDDPTTFDGFVWEALRFRPPFPYFFRVCEHDSRLAGGTEHERPVAKGRIVMPCVHSAMFDEHYFVEPEKFDAARGTANTFHFGYGHHECLGRYIGQQMIPEIVRQVLRMPGVKESGPVDFQKGPFPEHYPLEWTMA